MKKNKLILDSKEIIDFLGKDYNGLAEIFSDKFGIINAMLKREELSKYGLYMYQCLSANAKVLYNLDREVSSGGLGVSEDEKSAMISCLAEAIERYTISYIPKKEVIYKKKSELPKSRVFQNFYTYSQKQYDQNKQFANPEKDHLHWTKVVSLDGKTWKYWPASLIYIPFNISKPVAETTTTGTAAGIRIADCIESGLLELIERDALMINFMQKLNPPEIDIETITGINKKFISTIAKDYSIKIYNLYTDSGVPTYLSLIWQKKHGVIHYGIGGCANKDSDIAINKSLKECLFTFFYSKNILNERKTNPNEITALYEHFLYYQKENFNKILFDSKKTAYKRKKITHKQIIDNLQKNHIDVYYKEITTADVANTGIKVVKVIAPGLIDLNKSHILPRLGADRFWTVPAKLNIKVKEELRETPHPFP